MNLTKNLKYKRITRGVHNMKIILSRKGFDGSNGGCPSPIMPDGAMLSMPIPAKNDNVSYDDLHYGDLSYLELLSQLNPKVTYSNCHLDPDIRPDTRKIKPSGWSPAFGQISAANTYLQNQNVTVGDLFLFFGWYHRVIEEDGKYRYSDRKDCKQGNYKDFSFYDYNDIHAVWGYMQIGDIITDKEKIKELHWHPHSSGDRLSDKTNAIYIPSKHLSFDENLPGYGTLNYRPDRVLTMEGHSKGNWIAHDFLMPENICGNRTNSSKCGGLYYQGIWQEIVLKESREAEEWARKIISK